MLVVFPALAVIAFIGASLRYLLTDLDVDATRRQCGTLVLNVLLPALIVEVIYGASTGNHLWQIPLAMLVGMVVCVAAALLVFKSFRLDPKLRNALVLGCAFGNVTYLGMPVLRGLFPENALEVTQISILCEITVTSANLITGALLALASGGSGQHTPIKAALTQVLKLPVLWSVAIATVIRVLALPLPEFVLTALHLLGEATSGLMLLVLGMAIKPAAVAAAISRFGLWWPMLIIKLGLSPLIVTLAGLFIGLSGLNLHATTLEAAMPPQLFILIVADRFGFDTETLAPAVAVLTIVSFIALPAVHHLMLQ